MPTTLRCDPEVFQKGSPVCVLSGSPKDIEAWVQSIAKAAGRRESGLRPVDVEHQVFLDGQRRDVVLNP
jgi:hypothetical protein